MELGKAMDRPCNERGKEQLVGNEVHQRVWLERSFVALDRVVQTSKRVIRQTKRNDDARSVFEVQLAVTELIGCEQPDHDHGQDRDRDSRNRLCPRQQERATGQR